MTAQKESGALENPFWRFSIDRYARPGVAPLCLGLQASFGVDVNLVLFGMWRGQNGWSIDGKDAARMIVDQTEDWRRQVVLPLRSVRKALKHMQTPTPEAKDKLRDEVKRLELRAEQLQQAMLYALTVSSANRALWTHHRSGTAVMVQNALLLCGGPVAAKPQFEQLADLCWPPSN